MIAVAALSATATTGAEFGEPQPYPDIGVFTAVSPARLLDTRIHTGGPLGSAATLTLDTTGAAGIPDTGITAVALNVTVTEPTNASYLTVHPANTARPTASNLNYLPGQTVPNMVITKVAPDGTIALYNNHGTTHVIVDIVGYYIDALVDPTGSSYSPVSPARLLDTRIHTGGPLGSAATLTLDTTGAAGIPDTGITAVALNVTVTEPTNASYLTVHPANTARPTASNLNYLPGQTVPNMVITKVAPDGTIALYNNHGTTHVIVDIVGYYAPLPSHGVHNALEPARLLDTRLAGGRLGPGEARGLDVFDSGGVPISGVAAVALNVTATQPTQESFLTVYPAGALRPGTSNLNFVAGETVPNMVVAELSDTGRIDIYNHVGTTDVVVDVVGWIADRNPNHGQPPPTAVSLATTEPPMGERVISQPDATLGPGARAAIASVLDGQLVYANRSSDESALSYEQGTTKLPPSDAVGILQMWVTHSGDTVPLLQCSATMISEDLLLTAFHCVDQSVIPGRASFAGFTFIPAATGRIAPYGYFHTDNGGSYWPQVEAYPDEVTGLRLFPPLDYATVRMVKDSAAPKHPGTLPGTVTGWHDVLINADGGPQLTAGYAPFTDECPEFWFELTGSDVCFPNYCYTPVDDYIAYRDAAFFDIDIRCRSKDGMSGGPVLTLHDDRWVVTSVISAGTANSEPENNSTIAPWFDHRTRTLISER